MLHILKIECFNNPFTLDLFILRRIIGNHQVKQLLKVLHQWNVWLTRMRKHIYFICNISFHSFCLKFCFLEFFLQECFKKITDHGVTKLSRCKQIYLQIAKVLLILSLVWKCQYFFFIPFENLRKLFISWFFPGKKALKFLPGPYISS